MTCRGSEIRGMGSAPGIPPVNFPYFTTEMGKSFLIAKDFNTPEPVNKNEVINDTQFE